MANFIAIIDQQPESEENRGNNIGLIIGACHETNGRLVPLKTRGTGAPRRSIDPSKGFDSMTEGCIYTISFSLLSCRILIDMPPIPAAPDLATDCGRAVLLSARGKIKFVHEHID
jgi:hypothetical protein